jgi:hypothetical protein
MSLMLFRQVLQDTDAIEPVRRAPQRFQLMTVTVDACEASLVRRALAGSLCAGAGAVIQRCAPQKDHRVKLEIRFCAGHSHEVMHGVLESVPSGEVGSVIGLLDPASNAHNATRH